MSEPSGIQRATFNHLCCSAVDDIVDVLTLGLSVSRKPATHHSDLRKRLAGLREAIQSVADERPNSGPTLRLLEDKLAVMCTNSEVRDLAAWWEGFAQLLAEAEGNGRPARFSAYFKITNTSDGVELQPSAWADSPGCPAPGVGFVGQVSAMCAAYRTADSRGLHSADRLALLWAYHLAEKNASQPPPMLPIRTDPQRPCHTYLFFADPGLGHLSKTVWDAGLLKGTIVHVETIDCAGIAESEQINLRRAATPREVARLRVHVGDAAPCSIGMGPPIFERPTQNQHSPWALKQSILNAAQRLAGNCSGLFGLGVAECKIGLEGLTAQQVVDYLETLSGNINHDHSTRRLSAAFNLTRPILNDLDPNRDPLEVGDRLEVGRLAILLAKKGGVNKVTWEGTSSGQLKRVELLELVHMAHERGLETCISGGMTEENIPAAVEVGVGAVGIGTMLHAIDNGRITNVLPERVRAALAALERALRRPAARAAAALAQLDWRLATISLTNEQETLRQRLFFLLLKQFHSAADDPTAAGHEAGRQRAEHELAVTLEQVNDPLIELIRPPTPPRHGPQIPTADSRYSASSVTGQILQQETGSQVAIFSETDLHMSAEMRNAIARTIDATL